MIASFDSLATADFSNLVGSVLAAIVGGIKHRDMPMGLPEANDIFNFARFLPEWLDDHRCFVKASANLALN